MLAVYYGCGLRLNEGASLELKDILVERKILHVRKGKHYKERLVPVAGKNFEELRLYVDYARPQLLQEKRRTLYLLELIRALKWISKVSISGLKC